MKDFEALVGVRAIIRIAMVDNWEKVLARISQPILIKFI